MQNRNGVVEQRLVRTAKDGEIFFRFLGQIRVRYGTAQQIALFVQYEREEIGKSVAEIVGQTVRDIATVERIHRLLLPRLDPQITRGDVRNIFRPAPVQEFRVRRAIDPPIVEWPIAKAQKLRLNETLFDEQMPSPGSLKATGRI